MNKKDRGNKGEDIAEDYLIKHRYNILKRNFRVRHGEIDIVAMDKHTLVFVEVKTRSNIQYGLPCEAVDIKKQRRMKCAARRFLSDKKPIYQEIRFDIIEIILDLNYLNHMKEAFI